MPPVELNFHITNLLPRKVESFSAVLNLKLFFINRYLLINFVQLTKANKRVTNENDYPTEVPQYSSEVPTPIVGGAAMTKNTSE